MNTLEELKKHLEKHNDAIIIIGPGVQKNTELKYTFEEFNENYTRKNFRRDPNKLWDFYLEKMYDCIDPKDIKSYQLLKEILKYSSLIVDQNINSPKIDNIKSIDLHGSVHKWICPKCKVVYTKEYVFPDDKDVEKTCELCGSAIRPTALFVGERYNQRDFDRIKDTLSETHTFILIGVDYTEESILKLLDEYGLHKTDFNSANEEESKIIVCIQGNEEEFNPNEISFCEFLVKDDIEPAMERLIKGLE